MFWTSGFLIGSTIAVGDLIKSFQYEINGMWADAPIISSEQMSEGNAYHVYKCFTLEIPSSVSGTITGFRAIGTNDFIIGSRVENIAKAAGAALVYKFKIRIHEEGK